MKRADLLMIEIERASDCVNDIRSQMTELFIEGFWHLLQLLSKDRNKLKAVFYHTFLLDKFFVAVENGRVIGMVGYAESTKSSLHLDKHAFKKYLGFFKGILSYYILKKEFSKIIPGMKDSIGKIEFVVVTKEQRGKGIAAKIIRHIFTEVEYQEFILETTDTNIPAITAYKKIGFNEYDRLKQKYAKQSGINYFIYLKYTKSTNNTGVT